MKTQLNADSTPTHKQGEYMTLSIDPAYTTKAGVFVTDKLRICYTRESRFSQEWISLPFAPRAEVMERTATMPLVDKRHRIDQHLGANLLRAFESLDLSASTMTKALIRIGEHIDLEKRGRYTQGLSAAGRALRRADAQNREVLAVVIPAPPAVGMVLNRLERAVQRERAA